MARDPIGTDAIASLERLLPDGAVLTAPHELRGRTRDWWALARLREVRGDAIALPDVVALPSNTEEVAAVLRWANDARIAVVPRGLGSGVCGGVVPPEHAIVLDMSRMTRIIDLDQESQVVEVEAGIRGSTLEAFLVDKGLTLGHYPQSIEISTVGGWIASSSAGQASAGYGAIENHLVGLTAVLPDGTIARLRPQPRAAVGPDLRRLLVGSEGILAVVTEAHLACAPFDPETSWQAARYPTFRACLAASRDLLRANVGARVIRGWDEADSMRAFGLSHGHDGGCVGLVGIATSAPGLEARLAKVASIAEGFDATVLDPSYGTHWWAHRLDAVALFERIMGPQRILGPGGMIDTLEVTGLWRDLPRIWETVTTALDRHCPEVRCHFSHVYPAGAALYFTFLFDEPDASAAEDAYVVAWRDALAACRAAGGSIAHHHGVGRLKAPALESDLGIGATHVLRVVKTSVDPNGILNPGALLATE